MVKALARGVVGALFPKVIAQIHSGLGNQMFQYATGRSLADRAGLELQLCQKDFSQDYIGRTYGLDAFGIRAEQIGLWAASVFRDRAGWRGKLVGMAEDSRHPLYIREPIPARFMEEVVAVKSPLFLEGYWQNEAYFADNAARIRNDFQPMQALPAQAEALALALKAEEGATVSVHVRRGDYAHHPHISQVHGVLSAEYYRDALAYLQAKLPDARFYVFSDEPDWVASHMPWPEQTVVVQTPEDAPAWVDMHLMSLCSHHVIANSSYSWWGAWLGERPGAITIAPQRWSIKEEVAPAGLIPERWIRL